MTYNYVALPNAVVACGYRQVKPYHFEQLFRDQDGFVGTEKDYLDAGRAYAYVPVDKFTRKVVMH